MLLGLWRQIVAQFDGEPVSRIVFTDGRTITNDRVHSFHVVTQAEMVAAIPEGV